MSRYSNVHVHVSENQKTKIKSALQNKTPVSIRLGHEDFNGDDILALTKTQINKMEMNSKQNKGVTLKLSLAQVKYNLKVEGGFLGMLAGLAARVLPFLLKTVAPALATGAISGIANNLSQKALGPPKTGSGLYLKRGGQVARIETDGKGLYLNPPSSGKGFPSGNGLYLKQGNQYSGSGIILGENSPFKNIPVLGWIL